MNKELDSKMAAPIVVVVVIMIIIAGYLYLKNGNGSSGKPPPEAEKFLHPGSSDSKMGSKAGGSDAQSGSPSKFPGYPGGH